MMKTRKNYLLQQNIMSTSSSTDSFTHSEYNIKLSIAMLLDEVKRKVMTGNVEEKRGKTEEG